MAPTGTVRHYFVLRDFSEEKLSVRPHRCCETGVSTSQLDSEAEARVSCYSTLRLHYLSVKLSEFKVHTRNMTKFLLKIADSARRLHAEKLPESEFSFFKIGILV